MNPLFTGKIKKAATTAPKFVPRLPLCLLKQLFFAYIAPVLYELRGLYVHKEFCIEKSVVFGVLREQCFLVLYAHAVAIVFIVTAQSAIESRYFILLF